MFLELYVTGSGRIVKGISSWIYQSAWCGTPSNNSIISWSQDKRVCYFLNGIPPPSLGAGKIVARTKRRRVIEARRLARCLSARQTARSRSGRRREEAKMTAQAVSLMLRQEEEILRHKRIVLTASKRFQRCSVRDGVA